MHITVRNHCPKISILVQEQSFKRGICEGFLYITPSEITVRNHRLKSQFEISDIITKIVI